MGTTEIIISLIGGFLAGIINTLAGFGSIITLAIYMDVMGIPGHLANATNRLNVMSSSTIGAITFYKNGKLKLDQGKTIIIAVFLGAMVGVYMATQLDAAGFKQVFKYILLPIFFVLLVNPKKFITPDTESAITSPWITMPLYFCLGIYAGFIQAGFGIIFLLIIVILSKFDLVSANGLKVAIVALYTLIIIAIFHFNDMIIWKAGIAMAIGQGLGGYVSSKNMVKMKGANKWAYYILVLIVFLVILKNFEVWTWFG